MANNVNRLLWCEMHSPLASKLMQRMFRQQHSIRYLHFIATYLERINVTVDVPDQNVIVE